MINIDYKKVGKRIREKRKEFGYTQEKLAEICDISTGFLGHIENGSRTPSLETLYSIACALSCGIDFFLFDTSVNDDSFFSQISNYVKKENPKAYPQFCKTVKILAEHINEIY